MKTLETMFRRMWHVRQQLPSGGDCEYTADRMLAATWQGLSADQREALRVAFKVSQPDLFEFFASF